MDALVGMLSGEFLSKPIWMWLGFISLVLFLLYLDLGVLNRKNEVVTAKKGFMMWGAFASLAIAFGGYIYWYYSTTFGVEAGRTATIQYYTGYLLETTLAFDNIFVISLVFTYFAVPREYQHRVLFWGIIGAIVFRAIFIGMGAAIVTNFVWVLYIFAAFLIFTGFKMLTAVDDGHGPDLDNNKILLFIKKRMKVTDTIESEKFFVKKPDPVSGKLVRYATPLFLALIMVEIVDIVFAIDSVPAIFAITQDPFIVYTSNIFAILGLRSMYFMLAAMVERFKYLKYGLSVILMLIGAKIFWNFGLKDLEKMGVVQTEWGLDKLDPAVALVLTISILGGSMLYSLWKTKGEKAVEAK